MLLPLLHQEPQSNQISSLDEATHLADASRAQTSEISLIVSLSDQVSESLLNTRISVIIALNNR